MFFSLLGESKKKAKFLMELPFDKILFFGCTQGVFVERRVWRGTRSPNS